MEDLQIGGIYRHYKGKLYHVTGLARHSETEELLVVYECLYENPSGKLWVRPLDLFLGKIGEQQRFEFTGERRECL